jgi:hypothetical protein
LNRSIVPAPAKDREQGLRHYRDASAAVVATVMQVAPADWHRPVAPGKWSPAEITEHLRLTAAALRREIETGEGMRVRTSWLRRMVLRVLFLRKILVTGRFPDGAKAVRELRPGGGPFDHQATTSALGEELRAFERALTSTPGARVTHPLFGVADANTALRFSTVHLLHHRDQIVNRER